jgi:hypothetical protein
MNRLSKNLALLAPLFLLIAVFHSSFAQEFRARQPVAMTNPGQSAEIAMVDLLAKRVKLPIKSSRFLEPAELSGINTLILILGASGKGLGEAGVDLPSEVRRARALIAAAKKSGIKLIGVHLGGVARRGENSQVMIDAVASQMDCLVVRSDGNKDGLFTKVASANRIPLFQVEKTVEVAELLKQFFSLDKAA